MLAFYIRQKLITNKHSAFFKTKDKGIKLKQDRSYKNTFKMVYSNNLQSNSVERILPLLDESKPKTWIAPH